MIKELDATGYSKPVKWCGPSALAFLASIPLREATEHLSRIRQEPYTEVEGVWSEEMVIALTERGYRATPIPMVARYPDVPYGPTLTRFWRERQGVELFYPLLVEVQGHLLVTHMGFAGDNWTKRMVPTSAFPKPGRLVKSAFIITKGT